MIRRSDFPSPIPTMFWGVEYRSRLEACWACLMMWLGWEFEYEPTGRRFQGWVPDFLIKTAKKPVYVEVKPIDFSRFVDRRYDKGVVPIGHGAFRTLGPYGGVDLRVSEGSSIYFNDAIDLIRSEPELRKVLRHLPRNPDPETNWEWEPEFETVIFGSKPVGGYLGAFANEEWGMEGDGALAIITKEGKPDFCSYVRGSYSPRIDGKHDSHPNAIYHRDLDDLWKKAWTEVSE